MLIMPGCLDIWITTQVRPDGSLEQTILFKGDSAEIVDVRFALMKEGDWEKKWTKIEKDKFELVVSKEFKSVKELNASMNPADTNLQVVRVNASLKRKFRWFFTRYEFSETILEANPFKVLDYHKYLTDEETRLISMTEETRKTDPGYDSVKYKIAEQHFEDFVYRSMYEVFYTQLVSVLTEVKSFTLSKQELESKKEIIYRYLVDSVKGSDTDDILKGIETIVNHPDIPVIRSKYADRFDHFQEKMKFHESACDDSYKFSIRMPGLLLQTSSPKVKGSETGWDLTYYDFFFRDYLMTAESRKVNPWAFIVAGLVLLVALVSLVMAALKKR
jgi:hypothetical protein